MKTLRRLTKTLLALCLAGFTQLASAGLISFNPTPALGNVADPIAVDLLWTGGVGEYIGDWDVEILFDASIADFGSISFDPDNGLDSVFDLTDTGLIPGGLYALQISLEAPADLINIQDGLGNAFRLASLSFTGVSNGQTALSFGNTVFGDENGNRIDPSLSNGQICVGPDGCTITIPAPGTPILLVLGLLALGGAARRRRNGLPD